ncbi:MAG: M48 family metalloprotease [Candidatus Aminicenantes bacterium]|nr:M48 family metalloprotease [Candidatus Aminicenantes bacterium]
MKPKRKFTKDFYEIQRQQWQKSLFLLLILFVFYFFLAGFVAFVFLVSIGMLVPGFSLFTGGTWNDFLLVNLIVSLSIAAFHFYDARYHGARFIRKRLSAESPDTDDVYHKRFINTVDEMRIAAGLPKVTPYIISAFAINSMALMEADKSPSIIVTEGLLAEFTREELQAVIAHELAHIIRGDTFYITLVCSLANSFERLRQMSEPQEATQGQIGEVQESAGGNPLVYAATSISSVLMHLLSTLISRQRELMADATAVELNRNPSALARAVYKAHVSNSFIGDFSLSYSPLFIVPPRSKNISDGLLSRIFNSHPPLMKRVRHLAEMVPASPKKIIDDVLEIRKKREKARFVLHSKEETTTGEKKAVDSRDAVQPKEEGVWCVRNPKGKWIGPFTLEKLLSLRFFTSRIWTKNIQEGIEATAGEFPQIRTGLRNLYQKKPVNPKRYNKCPRCRTLLIDIFYEGVAIKSCPSCGGKLVDSALIGRIIARREVAFSDYLVEKAAGFRENFLENPAGMRKINKEKSQDIYCPLCGSRMQPRPFTYHYIVPINKCFWCHKTWFDTDELEVLQLLIELR